jgi:hypothetical protein
VGTEDVQLRQFQAEYFNIPPVQAKLCKADAVELQYGAGHLVRVASWHFLAKVQKKIRLVIIE